MARPSRRWFTWLAGESGFALPFALMSMLTMGTLSVGVISYSTSNYGSAKRSDAERQALALAEAGLNYAYSTLYNSSAPTMDNAVPSRTVTLETGDATYYGVLSGDTWRLVGIGTVHSTTGATAPVVRTVSGKASLGSAQHGSANNAVWNYVYVDDPTATTSIGNSVNVNIPFYVRGNLRISNTAQVSSYALQVGGTLELFNSGHVGTSGEPIHEAHVGGGCRLGPSGAFTKPCGPAQRVYADISDATPTEFVKPEVDLNGWYHNARPGPLHGCTVGSFPGGFDNDALPQQLAADRRPDAKPGIPTAASTTPTAPPCSGSRCRTRRSSAATRSATTDRVRRVDRRPAVVDRADVAARLAGDADDRRERSTSTGRSRSATRISTTGTCSRTCSRSSRARDVTIGNNSSFQGAIYAVNDYTESNSSTIWGPIIARRVSLANSSVNHYVPIGTLMPGMPATYEEVVTITNEPGSWG